jgi:hypothetical protein
MSVQAGWSRRRVISQSCRAKLTFMANRQQQAHAKDIGAAERLATTGRAVAQGLAEQARGVHETDNGARSVIPPAEAQQIIDAWPDPQKNVARQILRYYGPPNEATPSRLFWHGNRPWKKTEITSNSVVHNWPAPHTDFLTQTIDYRVPVEMISAIAQWDGSVVVDRTRGEVSARCDSEAANILAMNMVHEIVTGKRTVEQARETSEQNTVAYTLSREAPYAERLLFDVPTGGTEDLDESRISGAIARQTVGKVGDLLSGDHREPTERYSQRDGDRA